MQTARRPIKSRSNQLIQRLASGLAARNVTPNSISVASMVFAALGSAALVYLPIPQGVLMCALCIQLRLLCNVLDGIVAVEHGKKSPAGAIFNELPDRVADTLFIVAFGIVAGQPQLGWCAALLALATAYIRLLGGTLGLPQDFRGPMAKQHRMAVLTLACVLVVAEFAWRESTGVLTVALWIITVGAAVTCVTRLQQILRQLADTGAGSP